MQSEEGMALAWMVLTKARQQGRDVWEVVEDEGLLLTEKKRRQIALETVTVMLRVLDHTKAENVLQRYRGGRPATAQEMFDAVLLWLNDYREALEAGHVG